MNSSSHAHNMSIRQRDQDAFNLSVIRMAVVLALGLIINYINGTLIHTFRKHEIFYLNPRYILFIHLVINDIIQLTTSITLLVLANIFYRINVSLCCLILMFTIFTTFNTPLNLAVMAVECYIAVCFPLRHTEFCTIKRTYIIIGWIWAMSVISALIDVFIVAATEPGRLFNNVIYCAKSNLFRHPVSLKKREVSYILCMIAVWLTIFYTYSKIFVAARAAKTTKTSSGDVKKARNTIVLHSFQLLLCMLTYVSHMIIKAMLTSFPKYSTEIIFISYIIVHVFPRLISPIVYGLRDKTFKQYFKKYVLC
ncbi:odorant receptor 131-2-like [Salarias fasciatus]|uniref:odorant receptor 131-2-like n=1 Tax=Salarias fasciatus TaxID=181472 RepID=UPI001176943C|nr:odorant receptor 131-2-like [Salarias fasciatus]